MSRVAQRISAGLARHQGRLESVVVLLLLLALSGAAHAAIVTVPGFSFEDPATATYQNNFVTGWAFPSTGLAGVQNTGSVAMGGTTGSQYGYLNASGVLYSAASLLTIAGNMTYTLTVDVANRSGFAGTAAEMALYAGSPGAGGAVAVTTGNFNEAVDSTFRQYQLAWNVLPGNTNIGNDLYIWLGNNSPAPGQFEFDNVRLDATEIPEPSALALVALVLAPAFLRRRQ